MRERSKDSGQGKLLVGTRCPSAHKAEEDASSTGRPRGSSSSSSITLRCPKATTGRPVQVIPVSLHGLLGSSGTRAGRQDHHASVSIQRGIVHTCFVPKGGLTFSIIWAPIISSRAQVYCTRITAPKLSISTCYPDAVGCLHYL